MFIPNTTGDVALFWTVHPGEDENGDPIITFNHRTIVGWKLVDELRTEGTTIAAIAYPVLTDHHDVMDCVPIAIMREGGTISYVGDTYKNLSDFRIWLAGLCEVMDGQYECLA